MPSALWDAHTLSKRSRPPGRFILRERKAQQSKLTVLTAHRLAGEPGTPVQFTFRTVPGIRTPITRALNAVSLADWTRTACERLPRVEPTTLSFGEQVLCLLSYNRMRADTGSRTRGLDLGKVAL